MDFLTKMRLTNQLRSALGIVAASIVVGVGIVFAESVRGAGDGTRINQSGVVRGATQRLIKRETNRLPDDPDLEGKITNIINTLIEGGEISGTEIKIPRTSNTAFLGEMDKVRTLWTELQGTLARYRGNPDNEALRAQLIEESEDFFLATNEAVFAAEGIADAHLIQTEITEIVFLIVELALLSFIGFFLLGRVSRALRASVDNVASTSSEIAASVEQQERILSQQAASVTETTTTVEELGASTLQSAEQAESSTAGARQAIELSESGTAAVSRARAGIGELQTKVEAIASQIVRLSEQTSQISSISDLVADIASQTNMLALNAAVEAARAGEQGRGFAVVAGEVRKLADQSKDSAEKIGKLIAEVQASINSTVMVTDEGTKTAIEGLRLTDETVAAFNGIAEAVNNVFLNNQQISLGSKQQAVGVQQVVSAMNAINLGSQESAAGVTQVRAAASQLADIASQMQESV
ncbi:MAG: methyl-accepting chemotaxis protein [Cyanobacteria bacterium J06641_5]